MPLKRKQITQVGVGDEFMVMLGQDVLTNQEALVKARNHSNNARCSTSKRSTELGAHATTEKYSEARGLEQHYQSTSLPPAPPFKPFSEDILKKFECQKKLLSDKQQCIQVRAPRASGGQQTPRMQSAGPAANKGHLTL